MNDPRRTRELHSFLRGRSAGRNWLAKTYQCIVATIGYTTIAAAVINDLHPVLRIAPNCRELLH
jgi:hypothetical protein